MRRALVIGRAAGVWDEISQAKALCQFDMIIAVGRAGVDYLQPVDRWVSWHADLFLKWSTLRKQAGGPSVGGCWSGKYKGSKVPRGRKPPPVPVTYVECEGGSSGFLAIVVAFSKPDPVDQVVLAGVPMDPNRAHYDKPEDWRAGLVYRRVWQAQAPILMGRVKSMSGWTAELLGKPTEEWLGVKQAEGGASAQSSNSYPGSAGPAGGILLASAGAPLPQGPQQLAPDGEQPLRMPDLPQEPL